MQKRLQNLALDGLSICGKLVEGPIRRVAQQTAAQQLEVERLRKLYSETIEKDFRCKWFVFIEHCGVFLIHVADLTQWE